MISKEQFLELKHLKSLGVPTTTICKKIGISVPSANKWLRMDEGAFENYLRNNTPYNNRSTAYRTKQEREKNHQCRNRFPSCEVFPISNGTLEALTASFGSSLSVSPSMTGEKAQRISPRRGSQALYFVLALQICSSLRPRSSAAVFTPAYRR